MNIKNSIKKRSLSVVLVFFTLLFIFTSCTKQPPATPTNSSTTTESTQNSPTQTPVSANAPKRKLTVELYDRGITDGDATASNNYTIDYIKESFGKQYNAEVEYILVPRKEAADKLNVMMASNSAPDVCFTSDKSLVFQYASQGGLTVLDPYYAASPNLQKYEEDNIENGKFNGEIVAIPGKKKHTIQHIAVIRKDWLDKLNLKAPTTTQEWYDTMVAFKKQDPGGLGEKNYPFLLRAPGTTEVNMILWSFVDMTEEEDFTLPYLLLPGWKDGMKFLNKMYNEGLINPEFALDKNDTMYNQAISTGAWGSGIHLQDTFIRSEQAKTMYKNIPDSDVEIISPFLDKNGVAKKAIYPTYSLFNIVPKASKVPDLAVQYLDWMAVQENAERLNNGIEGIHWKLDSETGLRLGIPLAERPEEWRNKREWGGTDFYILDAAPDMTLEKEALWRVTGAENGYTTIDKQQDPVRAKRVAELVKKALEEGLVGGFIDMRNDNIYDKPFESVSKYQNNLNKIYNDGFVKIITAPTDKFDSVYQQIVDQYLQAGGQAIIDEKKAYYKELHK